MFMMIESRAVKEVEILGQNTPIVYHDYNDLLNDNNIEVVVIAIPWNEHIRMAIKSMRAGKITAMEVCGSTDIQECWELVKAYEETKMQFTFLENCCYGKFEMLALALAKSGKLGTIVHCHGTYSHDLRDEILGGIVNRHYRLC